MGQKVVHGVQILKILEVVMWLPQQLAVIYMKVHQKRTTKQLDPMARGWPKYVQAVAVATPAVEESQKRTLGGKLIGYMSHYNIKAILDQRASRWLTPSRHLKFEAILLEDDEDLNLKIGECSIKPRVWGTIATSIAYACF